ncbi:MAG: hypothetical protein PWP23_917 [Candidatus Sumerlaeota bacterium]|nr:hypothetical protein [Candidatus Sumerlaeota bacterium]
MKKTVLIAAVTAVAALPMALAAQPTITHLQDVMVNDFTTVPCGITVTNDGVAYVAGNANRRVVKVPGIITTSPGAAEIALRTSDDDTPPGPVNWIPSSGLITAAYNPTTNMVLVAGDQYTDGMAILIDPTDDSAIYQTPNIVGGSGAAPRRVAGAEFYGDNIIAQFQAGNNYWQFNNTLSALTGPGFFGPTVPAATKDLAVTSSGDVLVSYNNFWVDQSGSGTSVGIHRLNDDATNPLSLTGNTIVSEWYTGTVTANGGVQGISTFTYLGNNTEYALLCLPESAEIRIIDLDTATVYATLTDPTNLTFPRDAVVVTEGSSQYLVVSNSDAPTGTTNGRISVFGIDGAVLQTGGPSSADGWEMYQ